MSPCEGNSLVLLSIRQPMSNNPKSSSMRTRPFRWKFGIGLGFAILGCATTLHSLKRPASETEGHKLSISGAVRLSLSADVLSPPERGPTNRAPVTPALNPTNCFAELDPRFVVHKRIEDAPAWAIPYGKEFWRQPAKPVRAQAAGGTRSPAMISSDINLGDVIDRVSHAFTKDGSSQFPQVRARTYIATFDVHGLRFSPHLPEIQEAVQGNATLLTRSVLTDAAGHSTRGFPQSDPKTEVSIRTVSIRSGNQVLYAMGAQSLRWSFLGDTAQALLNDQSGVIEHHQANSKGIEVAWVVKQRPPGEAALEIEFEIQGLGYAERSEQGHHFIDAVAISRVRVGRAFAVDSAGHRWELPTESNGGHLHVSVSKTIIAEATFPLAVDPLISPEFGMDTPVVGRAYGASPAVASDGTNHLVVWVGSGILGTRVTGSGIVLDANGIRFVPANHRSDRPAVASNGTNYLVVWEDHSTLDGDIYGSLVTREGIVKNPGGFLIGGASNAQTHPTVASNGKDYLVAWQDARNKAQSGSLDSDIFAARVTSEGEVLDGNGIAVCVGFKDKIFPALASDGENYLVTWTDNRAFPYNVYAARITTDASVLDPDGFPVNTAPEVVQTAPSISYMESVYLITWTTRQNNRSDIAFARVTINGIVLDPNARVITSEAYSSDEPDVAVCGTNFVMVWTGRSLPISSSDIYAARVSIEGVVLDPGGKPVASATNEQWAPAIACGKQGCLVAWQDRLDTQPTSLTSIFGASLSPNSASDSPSPFLITASANREEGPAVASNGQDYFVVWLDYRNSTLSIPWPEIYGVHVNEEGVARDPAGIAIASGLELRYRPAVAGNSNGFLVVWDNFLSEFPGRVYGKRVANDGSVDPNLITIALSTRGTAAVASNGRDFLVAWEDCRSGSCDFYHSSVFGARVTAQGAVLEAQGMAIAVSTNYQKAPAIASDGKDYLVVWEDGRNSDLALLASDIYGARVTSAGAVLEPGGIPICTAPNSQSKPSVASCGTNFLVVWEDSRASTSLNGSDIYGARVTGSGTVVETAGLPICTATNWQHRPIAASDGKGFLVVWKDERDIYGTPGVFGARVTHTGTVVDRDGFALADADDSNEAAATASNGRNFLIVWTRDEVEYLPRARGVLFWPVAPARLFNPAFSASRHFLFSLSGETNFIYLIEVSPDLSNWTSLAMVTNRNGSIVVTDPGANPASRRFYRAKAE